MMNYSAGENSVCTKIRAKDIDLREKLERTKLTDSIDPPKWFKYLASLKATLGNLNNDLSFVATLLVKQFLDERFGTINFDASGKPQGASGIDIETCSSEGQTIVGEIKTTTPYQPGFGAQQQKEIKKDLKRLEASSADYRFMFVTDPDTFRTLCKPVWAARSPGIELVDLITKQTFKCPKVQ
jgi:hypothetical protein